MAVLKRGILAGLAGLVALPALAAEGGAWYHTPTKIQVDGIPLDTANKELGGVFGDDSNPRDAFGHAAPFFTDIDGDGKRDLILGTFAGRFRLYKNVGTDAAPKFHKEFTWLKAGDEFAQVSIYCCVASGPQMIDLDKDGILDLTAGSYDPGAMYWFRGLGNGQYADRQTFTGSRGIPIFAHFDELDKSYWKSFMANVAWADWNNDGHLDLIFGDFGGELFVSMSSGPASDGGSVGMMPTTRQPVFSMDLVEIRLDGQKAIPAYHAAPTIADWDGDGLWDILVGTDAGSVYFLRNSGVLGKPEFKSREEIIPRGEGVEQLVERGAQPRRGIRAQIQAVDYNNDGKLDLLVGDWSDTMTPRAGLSAAEQRELKNVLGKLAAVDRQVGFDYTNWRHKWPPYDKDGALLKQAEELREQLMPYLEQYKSGDGTTNTPWSTLKPHGHVWVFLRK